MKIFLVGFMGCGKSYIGRQLAEKLGFLFVDVDSLIENTEGDIVAHIFENQGETYFRKIESERLKDLKKWSEIVIATGGGAACFHDNMAWMNENGMTVYLKATPELLLERLKNEAEKRPLLRGRTEPELLDFIKNKVAEREFFYNQANIIIEQNENNNEIVFDILQKILNHRIAN